MGEVKKKLRERRNAKDIFFFIQLKQVLNIGNKKTDKCLFWLKTGRKTVITIQTKPPDPMIRGVLFIKASRKLFLNYFCH